MIRILPETLVNKIAAGEVIARPASVIKELVENSLDAGASRIEIETGNDCRDLRVSDDGIGMDREDAQLALVRHATSKITQFDDLWTLSTRGFRGEALASIAAVSRLQILTRRRGNLAGTRIIAEGPGEVRIEPAGAPEGAEVRVRDLFFNTPARLKFMKTAAGELHQVLYTVTRQALTKPEIGFSLVNEKSSLMDLPANQGWADRVAMLLGSQVYENLIAVDYERHGVRVRGFVVKPSVTRKDRRQQFFFVDGRPISSRSLSHVVQQAFHGMIMTQRFPIVVLDIVFAAGEVDVNVHPTKEEVRFRNESMVNGVVHRAVHQALQGANLLPPADLGTTQAAAPESGTAGAARLPGAGLFDSADADFRATGTQAIPVDFSMFTGGLATFPEARQGQPGPPKPSDCANLPGLQDQSGSLARQVAQNASAERELEELARQPLAATSSATDLDAGCSVRPVVHSLRAVGETGNDPDSASVLFRNGQLPEPLGQIAQCYVLARTGNDLLLIDQHAAHERLLYLKFSRAPRQWPSQPLLVPVSADLPAAALPYMERLIPVLAELGLRVEPFGGQTYLVQSTPADLPHMEPQTILSDLLDDFEALGKVKEIEVLRDRAVTRMACRAAIKAGQQLHIEEMRALIRDIAGARLGFTCPHGRPTMILLTKDQLDRQFKRKL